jgi:hypothetical protein
LALKPGDTVTVSLDGKKLELKAKADPDCPAGTVYAYQPLNFGSLSAFQGWEFFHGLPSNPVRVNLQGAKTFANKT